MAVRYHHLGSALSVAGVSRAFLSANGSSSSSSSSESGSTTFWTGGLGGFAGAGAGAGGERLAIGTGRGGAGGRGDGELPMLRPETSGGGGDMDCLAFSVTTVNVLVELLRMDGSPLRLTSVHMSLLGKFIVGVTVGVNRAVELLKSHERRDKLVVGAKETAEPLFGFNVVDLWQLVREKYQAKRREGDLHNEGSFV